MDSKFPPILEKKFKMVRELGQGAYGVVCSAKNVETGQDVAIKKVQKVFEKSILAKRALREIKLLRHFNGHENITSILDMEITDVKNFNEIYLVQELMEADLHQIVRSEQPLTDAHFQYFIYQVCRGLKYIHSANVLHRDLKPGNLLVNADCELKICDFGLARGLSDSTTGFMTEYVATRWYRAPEIMLSFKSYTKAIDLWSVDVDQLNQILGVLGTPDDATLRRIGSERAQLYIRSLPKMKKVPWAHLYPKASPAALDLLEKLLTFDPAARIDVEQALAHPYLEAYHDIDDEVKFFNIFFFNDYTNFSQPSCSMTFDFAFEAVESIDEMKSMIAREVMEYKAHTMAQNQASSKPNPVALSGLPTKDLAPVDEDQSQFGGAMDIDEELKLREQNA
ncbi:Mitogen-activated protein kinase [Clydaea vesicula]|uniref:Mitogen-activated protein kinase n=1 Tax=Clydaea vesicula TaxID=447962 RepID=A0AAD5XS16_9FUNG|nr:Mitogen-activated protein kinase [Clydaea vesicula]